MKKVHFALIGAGKMGARWAGVIAKEKKARLAMVIDTDLDKAWSLASQYDGCSASERLDGVLASKYIDAFLIATPHKYLAPITETILKAKKHVLCEKPGANQSWQIKENIKIAKKNKLVYKIGYNYRFHDGFIKARKFIKYGDLGKILFIRARHGFGGRVGYEKEWRINSELGGGGHLHDQGVHLIDMCKSFMGEICEVKGLMSDTYWKAGTEDNAFVIMKDKDGVIASIHSSLTQWKRMHSFEIYGTKGYLTVEGLGMRYGNAEKLIIGQRTKDVEMVQEMIIPCDPIADNSLSLELKEFISAIRKGTPLSPTAEDSYKTLKVVEEVYKTNKI